MCYLSLCTMAHITLNDLAWQIQTISQKFNFKEGIKEKISYERRDYQAVVDAPQSKTI